MAESLPTMPTKSSLQSEIKERNLVTNHRIHIPFRGGTTQPVKQRIQYVYTKSIVYIAVGSRNSRYETCYFQGGLLHK